MQCDKVDRKSLVQALESLRSNLYGTQSDVVRSTPLERMATIESQVASFKTTIPTLEQELTNLAASLRSSLLKFNGLTETLETTKRETQELHSAYRKAFFDRTIPTSIISRLESSLAFWRRRLENERPRT